MKRLLVTSLVLAGSLAVVVFGLNHPTRVETLLASLAGHGRVQIGDTLGVIEAINVSIRNLEPVITPAETVMLTHYQEQYDEPITRGIDTTVWGQARVLTPDLNESWESATDYAKGSEDPLRYMAEWRQQQTRVVVLGLEDERVLVRTITPMPSPIRCNDWVRSRGLMPCPKGAVFFLPVSYCQRMAVEQYIVKQQAIRTQRAVANRQRKAQTQERRNRRLAELDRPIVQSMLKR